MSIKAVIFDFFGVISAEVAPFWFEERFPREEARRLKELYMSPADRGDVTEDELFASLAQLTGEDSNDIKADFARRVLIDSCAVELAESLGKNYKIALLSNAMEGWLEDILAANDLNKLFSVKVISGSLHIIKPESAIYEEALKRLDVEASEAIFIDDNIKNVRGASAVGIHGIEYRDVETLKNELISLEIEF